MTATFLYDFSSPYAYLAAMRIDELVPDAVWQPIAFGIILRETGRVPWSLGPSPEGDLEEIARRAAARRLPPLRYPPGWPRDSYTLAPLRAAIFASDRGRLREFTLAAYSLTFAEGRVLDAGAIASAARAAGMSPRDTLAATDDPAIKERLRRATDDALARGVVGLPTVIVGDRLLWGDDRLEEAVGS